MPRILFICGMPGSGKSTIGKKLASRLGWGFVDLDAEIERKTGKSPAEWLKTEEEQVFRALETKTLQSLNLQEPIIISCGGGTPCFNDNLEWMLKSGRCAFIQLPLKSLANRLLAREGTKGRPLLQGDESLPKRLERIWKYREPFYQKIDWWINGLSVDLNVLANEVKLRVK